MIKTYRKLVKGEGGEDEVKESAALQIKMALDDAGVKIKKVKSGKLIVDKKDKKKAMKALAKSFKKGKAPELQFEDPVDPNPEKSISKLFSNVKELMKWK